LTAVYEVENGVTMDLEALLTQVLYGLELPE